MTREKFNEYVHKQSRILYAFAFRILRNQEEAEDAVQEIFIKLWNMGTKIDEYNSIEALATTMIKNYCIDQIRKSKHRIYENTENQPQSLSQSPSPHEELENKETNIIINEIIEKLEDKYRIVIELRELNGLSYDEISEMTGQNVNSLRVTLSRARGFIRDEFKKYNNEKRRVGQTSRKVL
jgi:RNA polymerase sigma factor (sigma-70 family)